MNLYEEAVKAEPGLLRYYGERHGPNRTTVIKLVEGDSKNTYIKALVFQEGPIDISMKYDWGPNADMEKAERLARAILLDVTGEVEKAERHWKTFLETHVLRFASRWQVLGEVVKGFIWIEEILAEMEAHAWGEAW